LVAFEMLSSFSFLPLATVAAIMHDLPSISSLDLTGYSNIDTMSNPVKVGSCFRGMSIERLQEPVEDKFLGPSFASARPS
jgi:hypothetical protein